MKKKSYIKKIAVNLFALPLELICIVFIIFYIIAIRAKKRAGKIETWLESHQKGNILK